MPDPALRPGDVVWCELDPTAGREQGGRRPVLVVASPDYLDVVDSLAIVLPVTATDRGWINHVPLTGEGRLTGYAMTEQVRTVSRSRLHGRLGRVDVATLTRCTGMIREFLA